MTQGEMFSDLALEQQYDNMIKALGMKQETLEEAGVAYGKTVNQNHTSHMLGFLNGAKWQQQNSYSEEEVLDLLQDFANDLSDNVINIKFWFEKFKNK